MSSPEHSISMHIGAIAPDFEAPVYGGDFGSGSTIKLSEFRGKKVVLVFYPKDSTPG